MLLKKKMVDDVIIVLGILFVYAIFRCIIHCLTYKPKEAEVAIRTQTLHSEKPTVHDDDDDDALPSYSEIMG